MLICVIVLHSVTDCSAKWFVEYSIDTQTFTQNFHVQSIAFMLALSTLPIYMQILTIHVTMRERATLLGSPIGGIEGLHH